MTEWVDLELTAADIPSAVSEYTHSGVVLLNIVELDALRICMTVNRRDLEQILRIAGRRGDGAKVLRVYGPGKALRRPLRHPVLIAGVLMLVFLTAILPTRVLFVQIEGNKAVPTNLILEKAAQCGIVFAADRGAVRSEKTKNALLEAIPELQWAGINTQGCVAVITVEERQIPEGTPREQIGSMVACRDGVIREITAIRGTALCKPGQSVRTGEVLISGYTDCGGVMLAQGADGEVFAETRRTISAVTVPQWVLRGAYRGVETKFSVILGKNRINFYEDSGILDTSCVKMYSEYYMTLPGGFRLPLVVVRQQCFYYDAETADVDPERSARILDTGARAYLLEQTVSGQILEVSTVPGPYTLDADYICLEMIGQIRYEENTDSYGENYGKNG